MNSGKSNFKMPKQRNLGGDYKKGINMNIRYLPKQLQAEAKARQQTDAARVAAQQQLQKKFGPTQATQQLAALNQLAPGFSARYNQLGAASSASAATPTDYERHATSDLASGYHLPPGLLAEVQNTIRGRQAMSGNTEGPSSIGAEASFTGSAMNNMYQQRMQNAATGEQMHQARLGNLAGFLSGANPAQAVAGVAPIQADRSFAYVNPNAGYLGMQSGQQQFSNQLGAAGIQASGGGGGGFPWGSALSAVGSIAGAFSDRRLKKDIKRVGTTPLGLAIYKYTMKATGAKMIGGMADDIEKKVPGAVHTDPSGVKMVDYSRVDVPIRRIA
jgi:hypothetical protein